MIRQSPKHIIKNFRNRNISIGKERRLNMSKVLLENQPHFPKTLTYEDFDREVFNWLDNEFDLYSEGKRFNTYKLFSNQRITEYGQTWKNVDEKGNLDINFKTITREPNPQKGEIQGGNYNIPGDITFPIFKVQALDENGVEYIEVYSMRQPTQVNFIYTVGVFTNTYKILNQMNAKIQEQFKSIEKYIFPNGFAIPMELNSVNDESEYTIDDRKYYSQTYQIKVMGYVVTEDDYVVSKMPSRARIHIGSGKNVKEKKNDEEPLFTMSQPITKRDYDEKCELKTEFEMPDNSGDIDAIMNGMNKKSEVEIEELCGKQVCWKDTEDELYVNRKVVITWNLDCCTKMCQFTVDYHLGIESIELKNIQSYSIEINGTLLDLNNPNVDILKGDNIKIEAEVRNKREMSSVSMVCYDYDEIIENDIENTTKEIETC